MDDKVMPQFMFKSPRGTGYMFRRGVPADVRAIVGKREFKVALGGDYRSACQRCRELAVETDQQIASARSVAASAPKTDELVPQFAPPAFALTPIHEVNADLMADLHATVIEQVTNADKERRYRSLVAINPSEKLREIERLKSWAMLAKTGDETAVRGWSGMLTGTLKRNGYCLSPELSGTSQERQLLIEYASAYRDALDLLEAEYSGTPSVGRQAGTPILQAGLARAPAMQTMLLSAAVKEFLHTLAPGKRAMNEKHAFIMPAFLEVAGDMPITELRQGHVNEFLRTVQKLPPRWPDLRRKSGQAIRELASGTWSETLSLNTYEGTYATLIDQAAASLQRQAPQLKILNIEHQRTPDELASGALFVITWQTVATKTKESRLARTTGDDGLSVDDLIAQARALGLRVGVVVDEAHHGFVKAQEPYRITQVSGVRLSQSDADLFFWLLSRAYRLGAPRKGALVYFKRSEALAELGRSRGGKTDALLEESLHRLSSAEFTYEIQDAVAGRFRLLLPIEQFASGTKPYDYKIVVSDDVAPLLSRQEWLVLPGKVKRQLSQDSLAKGLYAFYASHKTAFPMLPATLKALMGRESMQESKWRHALEAALAKVQAATGWFQFELVKTGSNAGKVVFVRGASSRRRPIKEAS